MNRVRQALLERRLTVGSWIQTGSPTAAEILADAGFQWVAADCEHSDIHIRECAELMRAMHGRGPVPLVRVRENDPLAIRQMLDLGAMGVIVPLVNTAEEARRAVAAAKYPPEGVRGFCFSRMNRWGADFDGYIAAANEEIAVVAMIESRQAVENIDAILEVPGVDGVFIGPYDMSGSYGVTGQTDHPAVRAACRRVSEACARHGRAAGMHIVLPTKEAVARARRDGFTFLALGADIVFLRQGANDALQYVNE